MSKCMYCKEEIEHEYISVCKRKVRDPEIAWVNEHKEFCSYNCLELYIQEVIYE